MNQFVLSRNATFVPSGTRSSCIGERGLGVVLAFACRIRTSPSAKLTALSSSIKEPLHE
jgi:hypothetical protein